ncbi:MAG: glycosyltransferase family 4 protein [Chitinophagales bacterium]|nr:glycosyltransferase family 4 protein [Chitinophagales bacterium]
MRLAIVTTHPIQYNAPWFRLLAQQQGVEVKVFYTWEASQTIAKYDPGFGRVVEWDIPLLDGYEYTFVKNVSANQGSHHFKGIDTPTLNSEIEQWGAEAVLVFGWAYKSHLACLRYFKGKIPVLFRGDSTLLDRAGGVKELLKNIFLKFVYRHIDYALYVGTNNKEYFLQHGVKEHQLVYVPHAIENERFIDIDGDYTTRANEWKRELGIEGCFNIVFAGKLEPKKNPEYLLQLAAKLPATNLRFVYVGNGILEEKLKNSAKADNRILFVGFQNQQNMPLVYRLANVFVLPSKGPGETWGLAINEAMACGVPVIASDKAGGAVDLIKDNGLIINPDNVNAGVHYIERLMNDSGFEQSQRNKSEELIKQFSFQVIVATITSFLKKLESDRKGVLN